MNPYYTHQDSLISILDLIDKTKKIKILEFGSGEGSSPILHDFAKNNDVEIHSYEHDGHWLNQMQNKYSLTNYQFHHCDWNNFDYTELKKSYYDFIFVDQGDWDARIVTIDELINNADYFILHDYCYYNGFRGSMIPDVDKGWALSVEENTFFHTKYSKDFIIETETTLFPPTLILKKKQMSK